MDFEQKYTPKQSRPKKIGNRNSIILEFCNSSWIKKSFAEICQILQELLGRVFTSGIIIVWPIRESVRKLIIDFLFEIE